MKLSSDSLCGDFPTLKGRRRSFPRRDAPLAVWWLVGLGVFHLMGCRDPHRPPVAPAPKAAVESTAVQDVSPPSVPNPTTESSKDNLPPHHPPQSVELGAPAEPHSTNDVADFVAESESSKEAQDTPLNAHVANGRSASATRLLILLPSGPLLGDVVFSIAGRPHEDWVRAITEEVMRLADTNQDGVVSWREATTDPRLVYGQLGNERIENEDQRLQIVYRCDVNRDDQMDATEVAAFLAGQRPGSHWINVDDGVDEQTPRDARSLFAWLDADQDDLLDAHEIELAPQRLRMLDRDDDGVLLPDDVPGATQTGRRSSGHGNQPGIILLQQSSEWSRVLFLMEDRYAFGSPIRATDLPYQEALFESVDADADGEWSVAEVSQLLTRPADLVIHVDFGASSSPLTIGLESRSQTAISLRYSASDSASLELPRGELVVQLQEGPPDRLMDTEWDSLWRQWDRDADETLDADEYGAAESILGPPFDAADANDDGRLQRTEGWDVVRKRRRAQEARLQIQLTATSRPVWMRLDADRDNRLTERELRAATDSLAELMTRTKGIALPDFPAADHLIFTREMRGDAAPSETVLRTKSPLALPAWFIQMDQNRDDEISAREFLGDPQTLKRLDGNADGALQPHEVQEASLP